MDYIPQLYAPIVQLSYIIRFYFLNIFITDNVCNFRKSDTYTGSIFITQPLFNIVFAKQIICDIIVLPRLLVKRIQMLIHFLYLLLQYSFTIIS